MIIIIAFFTCILSGMGIGGGSIFVLINTVLNILPHKEAAFYNLVMFSSVGIPTIFFSIKNKILDKKMFMKFILCVCSGSALGIYVSKIISEERLKKIFYLFMLFIGIYEIITSLKSKIKQKIIMKERS